jgi:hypothetical protein
MSEGAGAEWEQLLDKRHPATREKMRRFEYGHLREGLPRNTSMLFATLAVDLVKSLNDGSELTIALDRLREAKDRAVSQAITDSNDD